MWIATASEFGVIAGSNPSCDLAVAAGTDGCTIGQSDWVIELSREGRYRGSEGLRSGLGVDVAAGVCGVGVAPLTAVWVC